jgi:hypothetical protein
MMTKMKNLKNLKKNNMMTKKTKKKKMRRKKKKKKKKRRKKKKKKKGTIYSIRRQEGAQPREKSYSNSMAGPFFKN